MFWELSRGEINFIREDQGHFKKEMTFELYHEE